MIFTTIDSAIIDHVKEHGTLPNLSVSKQARNYHVKRLKIDGILKKIGYSVWEVDEQKQVKIQHLKQVKKQHSDAKIIRGHGFHYRVRIPSIPNWHKRAVFLEQKGIINKESQATWKGQRLIIRNYKVWLLDNSIVIYAPKGKSFYDILASKSKRAATYELEQILIRLEAILGANLKIKGNYQFKISKQHYARIKDYIAHDYNKNKKKLNLYINDDHWLVIDHSLNRDELETLKPDSADNDQDKVVGPFLNDLKDHHDRTGESLTIGKVLQIANKIQDNQMLYAENVKAHISAIKKLGTAVSKLNKEIRKPK